MKTICCAAEFGNGGLGAHLAQLVDDARGAGELARYFCFAAADGNEGVATVIPRRVMEALFRWTPLRWNLQRKNDLTGEMFDVAVARRLEAPLSAEDELISFAGQALNTFGRARELGWRRLTLVAANSHANNVARQHALARRQWSGEWGWLSKRQQAKMLREYELADRIQVASEYVWESFVNEGVDEGKLVRVELRVDERFTPGAASDAQGRMKESEGLRVIYVGSVSVAKGIPVLLATMERYVREKDSEARLVFVGGTQTRAMRRYIAAWQKRLALEIAPGDPLPHLRRADLLVHPSFEDGFAYAPMEAMACGVPVIVTDQTGMKEHIHDESQGAIVPAGDVGALFEAMCEWGERINGSGG